MSKLELRLFGGFDARSGGEALIGFESQKARALLAYLAVERRRMERESLAALLWSDRSTDSARRNLRQTLHSIRVGLRDGADNLLQADHHGVWLDPDADLWVDVEAFATAVRGGLAEGGVDPHQLTIAARLYTGEMLAGFYLKGCPEFEEWLVTEQERLREEAVAVLRALVTTYRARGEYRFGIQYARRLLFIDPLSEEAHRELMHLYARAGHRPRALAQYEKLTNLLETELGVEPLEETKALYRSILLDELPSPEEGEDEAEEPIGPLIPLVGRADAFARLEESWSEVLEGRGRLTLLEGEAGAGKSRLAKSFVDRATTRRRSVVLRGRAYQAAPLVAYQPVAEMLEGAFADILPYDPEGPPPLAPNLLADLALVAPRLRHLAAAPDGGFPPESRAEAARIPTSVLEFLDVLSRASEEADPLPIVMLLDDLQWADQASRDLLSALSTAVGQRPIWILVTRRTGATAQDPLAEKTRFDAPVERLAVGRLSRDEVAELAGALVDPSQAAVLGDFLWEKSEGLPLAAAELVNHLWDRDLLTPARPGQWHLRESPRSAVIEFDDLNELIHRRVLRLPHSSRRLISLAATIGHQFDAELLQRAANEHLKVIEVGIELMLESWLIRQFPRSWSPSGRESDLVLWARGVRRGWFQFAHAAIRTAILEQINPLRQQAMHRQLATALRAVHADDLEEVCERVAFHEMAAGEWQGALPCLEASAAKAERCGADAVAEIYRRRAVEVIDRLLDAKEGAGSVASLEGARRRLRRASRGAPEA